MYSKKTLIALSTAASFGLLVGAQVALASDQDSAPSARQTEIDAQFARSHPTVPGVPYGITVPGTGESAYGYVPTTKPAHRPSKIKK